MQRLIDANRLLSEDMKAKYYHLPNGDIAIPIIDIEHAPTVDTVPAKHAHWEGEEYSCSNCHENLNSIMDGWSWFSGGFNGTPYCPYCGAKMDLEGLDDHNGTD